MTPYETGLQEISAILQARTLLQRLSDHQLTPRIPREVRAEARALLRWFPRPEALRPALQHSAHLLRQGKPGGKGNFESQEPHQHKAFGK